MVGLVVMAAASCTVPARTATLEREQHRLRDDVATLEARIKELEGRLTTLGKRVGTETAARKAERDSDPRETRSPVDAPPNRRSATPTAAPTVLPDLDGLQRESSRQLPAGYRRGIDLLRAGSYEDAIR